MDKILDRVDAWLIALGLAVAMLLCWGLGWWRGKSVAAEVGDDPGTKFIDASLALLGLLLAFTFAIALGRYDQRRLAVIAESNAIADFYTCATLLKEPYRSRLQVVISEYARDQLATPHEGLEGEEEKKATERCQKKWSEMTEIVDKAIAEGTPIVVPLTNTLNNLTSSSALRLAMYKVQLPWIILSLLIFGSIVPAYLIGEKQGMTRKMHRAGSLCFIGLVTLVIFVTVDLNQPRRGLILVSQEPLERVLQSMAK